MLKLFTVAFAAAASLLGASALDAQPLAGGVGGPIRAVRIDTSVLAAGQPAFAALIQHDMENSARAQLAGRLAPGDRAAPILLIRLTSALTAGFAGNEGFDNAANQDYLEGEYTLGGVTRHLFTQTNAGQGGPWFTPGPSDARRYQIMTDTYMSWVLKGESD